VYLILLTFRSQLQDRAYECFGFGTPTSFGYTHVGLFIVR
jgi:hypothetical protein